VRVGSKANRYLAHSAAGQFVVACARERRPSSIMEGLHDTQERDLTTILLDRSSKTEGQHKDTEAA
jgi:hypothetical protein